MNSTRLLQWRPVVSYGIYNQASELFSTLVDFQTVKPFTDIPGPIKLPYLGNLYQYKLGYYNAEKYHEVLFKLYKQYGPIVKEQLGRDTIVHIYDPDDIRIMFNNEGKWPEVVPLQRTTQMYRKLRSISPGLGNINGEEWYRLRMAVRQMMLRPQEVQFYLPEVESIAKSFVDRIKKKAKPKVPDLFNEVAKWTLESAGMVCFGKQLGCLSGGEGEETAEALIKANRLIFQLSGKLKFSLPVYEYIPTPKWKKLVKAEDYFYSVVLKYAEETITKIEYLVDNNKDLNGKYHFMSFLLSREELSKKDVIIITLSLFADGLSTTVPALLNTLYCLATNPLIQEKAYEEVQKIVPDNCSLTQEMLNKLNYLKAVVKESLRLYPIGTEISRITQKDLILSGFHIPARTHVDMNPNVHFLSDEYFHDANKFKPDRWLKDGSASNYHPYLVLPFGHGVRTCAGRRFAEQDLYSVLCYILKNLVLQYEGNTPLEHLCETLLFPKGPIPINFLIREKTV